MNTLLPLAIGMAVSLFAADWADAQEVRYDLTGNYPDTAPLTSLTAPGGAFDFQFVVPASVANSTPPTSPFYIAAPILSGSYTFGGSTDPVFSGTYVFSNSAGNVTDIDLTTSVGDISLSSPPPFFGPSVLATRPDASGQSYFLTGNLGTGLFDPIDFTPISGNSFRVSGGTTVSIVGAAVPEPSGLGLMALGLLSCGGVALLRYETQCGNQEGNGAGQAGRSSRGQQR